MGNYYFVEYICNKKHVVTIENPNLIEISNWINENIIGSFAHREMPNYGTEYANFHFELESDAMAFKLAFGE